MVYTLAFDILPRLFPTAPLVDRLTAAGASAVLFLLSILGHELGHALLARKHHIHVDGINLWILGGVAKLNRHAPTPKAEFEIAIAGPLASLVIGLVFSTAALVARSFDVVGPPPAVLAWLGVVNALLAVSNLIPAAPLDGGRVLTAALWKRNGDAETARLNSARCGIVAGAALTIAGLVAILVFERSFRTWSSAVIMGVFFLIAARSEVIGAAVRRRLANTTVRSVLTAHPPSVPGTTPLDRFATWAEGENSHVVFPITRWTHEPVGYASPDAGLVMTSAERSWTAVADVMVPLELVPRAWDNESADAVLRRMERSYPMAVIHEAATNTILGTVSQVQLHHLIERSDWWGRLPNVAPKTSPSAVHISG